MNDSPLARIREQYEARQTERHEDIDIWPDGALIARVGIIGPDDTEGARGGMRSLRAFFDEDENAPPPSPADMADVIAAATRGLYYREGDGEPVALPSEDGLPVRLDAAFGQVIGVPDIATPRQAVFTAFTEGEPPQVNVMGLSRAAIEITGWLATDADAESAVSGH